MPRVFWRYLSRSNHPLVSEFSTYEEFEAFVTKPRASLAEYLEPCEILRSQGRTHPVVITYLNREPGDEKSWDLAAEAAAAMLQKTEGNLLIFMPGAYEISRTISTLRVRLPSHIAALPLHGELPPAEQDAAVSSGGARKVIVATNVAETSLRSTR